MSSPFSRTAGRAQRKSQIASSEPYALAQAFEHCRRVNQHYGKTYYFSTCFFPRELRPAVHALYAWVRYPDEWVDNPGDLSLAEQRDKIRQWRCDTDAAIETGQAEHPVLWAFAQTARRYDIPHSYLHDFLGAMEMDLTRDRYETFADLQTYTWGSASVVGLMMCRIAGVSDPDAVPHATSLGLAMQLTNFLRDVGEDWRERGRIYLPLEDLRRFGISEEDLAHNRLSDNFCALVRFQAERARQCYAHADEGMAFIPARSRLPIRLARILYARILDKIEQNECDVLTQRARVSTREKLVVLAEEMARARRGAILSSRVPPA